MSPVCTRVLRTAGEAPVTMLSPSCSWLPDGRRELVCACGVGHLLGHWDTHSSITQKQITALAPSPDPPSGEEAGEGGNTVGRNLEVVTGSGKPRSARREDITWTRSPSQATRA